MPSAERIILDVVIIDKIKQMRVDDREEDISYRVIEMIFLIAKYWIQNICICDTLYWLEFWNY